MYVKLTKTDGSPIWLNAAFVVTVEPRRGGGSIVVPIGDGLDYDVRERPEAVLALLEGAPVPAVVPVPTRDALTQTPDDVSPEPEDSRQEPSADSPSPRKSAEPPEPSGKAVPTEPADGPKDAVTIEVSKPVKKRTTRSRAKAKAETSADDAATDKPKPARKARTTRKKKDEGEEGDAGEGAGEGEPASSFPLTDDQLGRLKRMMPGSLRKLQNTLTAQFRIKDVDSAVEALVARGIVLFDQNHVIWP